MARKAAVTWTLLGSQPGPRGALGIHRHLAQVLVRKMFFITVLKRIYFSPNVLQSWDSLICLAQLYFLNELREKWFHLVIKNHLC